MKQVAGTLRLELAQYRELAAFAQFGSDLDKTTQRQLARGERLVEVLKQGQYVPMPVEKQVVEIYAALNGYLDELPVPKVQKFLEEFQLFLESKYPNILSDISTKKKLDDDLTAKLNQALEEMKSSFQG
jgi:F-type H+-transporting ATPase subunit alpha